MRSYYISRRILHSEKKVGHINNTPAWWSKEEIPINYFL